MRVTEIYAVLDVRLSFMSADIAADYKSTSLSVNPDTYIVDVPGSAHELDIRVLANDLSDVTRIIATNEGVSDISVVQPGADSPVKVLLWSRVPSTVAELELRDVSGITIH